MKSKWGTALVWLLPLLLQGSESVPQKVLLRGLDSPSFWTKVHAAEYLIELNLEKPHIQALFLRLEAAEPQKPFEQVGRHRVLIRLGDSVLQRETVLKELALDDQAPDALHAVEAIGKLQTLITKETRIAVAAKRCAPDQPLKMRLFAAWSPTGKNAEREAFLRNILNEESTPASLSMLSVVGLSFFPGGLAPETLTVLRKVMDSPRYDYVNRLTAAELLLKNGQISYSEAEQLWLDCPQKQGEIQVYCRILASFAPAAVAEAFLRPRLSNSNLEIAMSAARALILLERRGGLYQHGFIINEVISKVCNPPRSKVKISYNAPKFVQNQGYGS